ncbi:MAG: CBS domain-containing protein [Desulfurococcales archaeon]|nr:CBS domain-containing protein [Desulfurococcales archaeon]
MKIWEVMREPARKVLPNTPLVVVRRLFRDTEERIIPIVRDEKTDKLYGYLTRIEAIIPTSTKSNLRVADVARDHPQIRADASVDEAFRLLQEFKTDAAPIVDEEGRLLGVVSYRDMIQAFLNRGFRPLAETVSEAMTIKDLDKFIVTPDTPINKVWSRFVFHGIPGVVVVRSKEEPVPIGVITPFDLIRKGRWRFHREIRAGKIVTPAKVRRIMTRGVVVATPDTPIEQVAKVMAKNDFSIIPVVDEEGRIVGIVTQADVVRVYLEGAKPGRVRVKPLPMPKPVAEEERVHYRSEQSLIQEVVTRAPEGAYKALGVTAGDIAREELPAITINDTVEHARREMLRRNTDYLLVVDEAGRIVGVVSKWNMLKAIALRGPIWRRRIYDKFFIDYVMTKVIPRVKADEPLENVALKMLSNGAEVAIVEDNEGNTIGFITKDDLIEAYAKHQTGALLVENVMVPAKTAKVHPHHSLAHAINKMQTYMLDALVVAEGDRIHGVISANRLPFVAYEDSLIARKSRRLVWVRRLIKAGPKKARYVKVMPLVAADAAVPVEKTLTPKDTVLRAIQAFREENVDGLPVVDEEGRLVGLVSKNTILREMARHAKVIVAPPTPREEERREERAATGH